MVTSNDQGYITVKIIDFSLSKLVSPDGPSLQTKSGSAYYIAPEILKKIPYNEMCDMWSLGVIIFFLFTGYPPFNAKNEAALFAKI
jgi:serine/threonine protein kinase